MRENYSYLETILLFLIAIFVIIDQILRCKYRLRFVLFAIHRMYYKKSLKPQTKLEDWFNKSLT